MKKTSLNKKNEILNPLLKWETPVILKSKKIETKGCSPGKCDCGYTW